MPNSWTAVSNSLMKFCTNMYLDNLSQTIDLNIKVTGQSSKSRGFVCVFLACTLLDSRNVIRWMATLYYWLRKELHGATHGSTWPWVKAKYCPRVAPVPSKLEPSFTTLFCFAFVRNSEISRKKSNHHHHHHHLICQSKHVTTIDIKKWCTLHIA